MSLRGFVRPAGVGPPQRRGFITASVVDSFGNVLGTMRNLHYLDILGGGQRA